MTLLLKSISHSYGSRPVLHDINAEAHPGRITVLIGPNAAGKTTLLRIAAGLLHADGGEVRCLDDLVRSMSDRKLSASISCLAQRPRQDVPLRVREVIDLRSRLLEEAASRALWVRL